MRRTGRREPLRSITVKVPRSLSERVARIARERGLTISDVVREALEGVEEGSTRPKPGSALELAGDLVGSIEGPGDLSTNASYFDGYGG
jgi:Ribbon-helix-helix protein, copG family